ncbi:MAG: NADH-quinone oxidoreductase subunit NuoH, partial [Anaerolineae bacterium]|nr:NADH-quinone oxidoreductase subunit NuoH [Anaerolineae bacterium]
MAFLSDLLVNLWNWIAVQLDQFLPSWATALVMLFAAAVVIVVFLLLTVMFLTLLERKVVARIADRIGPNRVGPFGLLQPIADTLKLIIKENTEPAKADHPVFRLAPAVVATAALMPYAVIPFGRGMVGSDVNIGVLYVISISSLTVIAVLMAGWGGGNKYGVLGGMRAVAQMFSFEVPLALSIGSVALLTGSLSLVAITEAQRKLWLIVAQPIAFLVYLLCGAAEANRAPFDIPEAESELVAGYHVEYSGVRFAFFYMAEYINMFTTSAMATILFLGGWQGPFVERVPILSIAYFLAKVYGLVFLMIWVRATFPRLRIDQLLDLSWKVLLPLALMNLLVTAVVDKVAAQVRLSSTLTIGVF